MYVTVRADSADYWVAYTKITRWKAQHFSLSHIFHFFSSWEKRRRNVKKRVEKWRNRNRTRLGEVQKERINWETKNWLKQEEKKNEERAQKINRPNERSSKKIFDKKIEPKRGRENCTEREKKNERERRKKIFTERKQIKGTEQPERKNREKCTGEREKKGTVKF